MKKVLSLDDFHPFVRCVGEAKYLKQELFHKAYDYRILAFMSGNGTLEVQNSVYNTKPDEVYIISPGTRYRVISKGRQDIIVMNIDMTHNNSEIADPVISVPESLFFDEKIVEIFDLSCLFGVNEVVIKRSLQIEGRELCEKLLKAYNDRTTCADGMLLSALFSQFMYHLISEKNQRHKNLLAEEIFHYVSENYSTDLSLERTAEYFHIHPTYLNRLLNKGYNISFRQLLMKTRFSQALYLIDNTDMTVKEISEKVGFNNPGYFSSAFFKHFGYYPTVYRK